VFAYANEITFLNDHDSVDSIYTARAPQPNVTIQGNDVRVVWKNIGLYLGNTASSFDNSGMGSVQEAPVEKSKKSVVDSFKLTAKRAALHYLNSLRNDPLPLSELNGRMVSDIDAIADFSNEDKRSEGFLFSYKQWLQFDLQFSVSQNAIIRVLNSTVERITMREERDLRRAEKNKLKAAQEKKRLLGVERESKRRIVEKAKRKKKEFEEKIKRLSSLNKIRWRSGSIEIEDVPIKEVVELYPYVLYKFSRMVKITSNVDMAELIIDGVSHGRKEFPVNIDLYYGEHDITISKDRYLDWNGLVNIGAEDTVIVVNTIMNVDIENSVLSYFGRLTPERRLMHKCLSSSVEATLEGGRMTGTLISSNGHYYKISGNIGDNRRVSGLVFYRGKKIGKFRGWINDDYNSGEGLFRVGKFCKGDWDIFIEGSDGISKPK